MNKLERIADIHLSRIQRAWGVPGRYLHPGGEIDLVGVPGSTETAAEGDDLVPFIDTDRDWIFDARRLLHDGQRLIPAPGHRWVVQWNDRKTIYLVANNVAIDRVFYYSEQSETIVRVYTKPRAA